MDDLTGDVLRNQINPAYQHLFELLSGRATNRSVTPDERVLCAAHRLLVHDGHGHHRFITATDVLYTSRGGIREIHGIDAELWTLVSKAVPL